MAGRLATERTGNIILKEMRNIGLEGFPHPIEEVCPRWYRNETREHEHRDRAAGPQRTLTRCGQGHLPSLSALVVSHIWQPVGRDDQTRPASRNDRLGPMTKAPARRRRP